MNPTARDQAGPFDIADAIEILTGYAAGRTRDELESHIAYQDAVRGRLMILGEAAGRLSQPFRTAHAHIPWRQIIGLRHVLAHQYDEINFDVIWNVLTDDLPRLYPRSRR